VQTELQTVAKEVIVESHLDRNAQRFVVVAPARSTESVPLEHPQRRFGAYEAVTAEVDSDRSQLSPREREVLEHIAQGKTDRQIAEALYISRITVSNHVVHILAKLGVPNRTAAAMRTLTPRATES
jgi:DNA-binding NarL/FixJ family response regulator